jgi:hypothetical protein
MRKAMDLCPDYSDAMAYRSPLYRQKADMELTLSEEEHDIKIADGLVDRAKAIKARKMDSSRSLQQSIC